MISYNTSELSQKAMKKLLIGVINRPIALVGTQSTAGDFNLGPFSYFNIASFHPPVISLAIQRKEDGTHKDTARNLLEQGEASVHIVNEATVSDANQTAASLPYGESELSRTAFKPVTSQTIQVPYLKEALIVYEARYLTHQTIHAAEQATADVFLLQIQRVHLSQEVYDEATGYVDYARLKPVTRLAGNDYATLGEIFQVERPD